MSSEQATFQINDVLKQRPNPELDPLEFQHRFYRDLYPQIMHDISTIENNWRQGKHRLQRINCESVNSKGTLSST